MSAPLPHEARLRTTVIGAQGFIGRRVAAELREAGRAIFAPERGDPALFSEPLGRVIYCAGVTSDFRHRPYDTMRAHVGLAGELLECADFASFVYVSSTRVYLGAADTDEQSPLVVDPHQPDHLFHLSKLAGESLCLHAGRPNVRIARVSNVLGDDFASGNFAYALIRDAVDRGAIELQTTLDSAKDYIGVGDVARLLIRIADGGCSSIYNVASGANTTNGELAAWIRALTGCRVAVAETARAVRFPPICIDRIRSEFGYAPQACKPLIGELVERYMKERSAP